jgi:hypothetical protein
MSTAATPQPGQKYKAGPHRTVVVEHVARAEVYYAIHDDDSSSFFPDRYRVPIQTWVDYVAASIAAGRIEAL